MAEKKGESAGERSFCPWGRFFKHLEDLTGNTSAFREHLAQSRLELLKAARILLDSKIDALEKRKEPSEGKVARKITIE